MGKFKERTFINKAKIKTSPNFFFHFFVLDSEICKPFQILNLTTDLQNNIDTLEPYEFFSGITKEN